MCCCGRLLLLSIILSGSELHEHISVVFGSDSSSKEWLLRLLNELNSLSLYWNDLEIKRLNYHSPEERWMHREIPSSHVDEEQRWLRSPSCCELNETTRIEENNFQGDRTSFVFTSNTFESSAEVTSLFSRCCRVATVCILIIHTTVRLRSPYIKPSIFTATNKQKNKKNKSNHQRRADASERTRVLAW